MPPLMHTFGCRMSARLVQQQVAESKQQPSFCPQASASPPRAQLGHLVHVVLRQRLLEEADAERLDHRGELRCMIEVEIAVGVDEQLDIGADRIAHRRDPRPHPRGSRHAASAGRAAAAPRCRPSS
jgi:hypothetical protein